ncbi:MAG TPA: DUF262 domain-containing protein [Acidobacteriaceae bacterium]|jgi:hypothetical protein|nr:DUF262 domain-containing protein [Acidobacteriaceae bacterium]
MAKQTTLAFGGATKGPIIEQQLIEKQRTIDYDTKEFTVELLVKKFEDGDFFIPHYQRAFVWHSDRQSKFVESVLLGLPIPFMFAADTGEGLLEVVDGAQRLNTLSSFMDDNLRLHNLDILSELEGCIYADVPPSQQRKFKNRTLRMVVLSDRTTSESKFNIFERINTGSDSLRSSEIRKGAYSGPFYDFIEECAWKSDFVALCPVGEIPAKRGERQELVLRFFAYSERYLQFSHGVAPFLNQYMSEKTKLYRTDSSSAEKDKGNKRERFRKMLEFVRAYFPHGFAKGVNATTTPRVRFEAISVGVSLALQGNPQLVPHDLSWLTSNEFERHTTTHASNSAPRLRGRVEYVRDRLLGA